jgi:hypothetical protein
MAYKHPYTLGSTGLIQVIQQLRKAFPPTVTAETLKKLGIAPNNESYVINTLKFIRVIDDDGNKIKEAASVFTKHDDAEFAQEFGKFISSAYSELFSLFNEDSWILEQSKLISFFRGSDESSAEVGRRQAITFQTLAGLSGHESNIVSPKPSTKKIGKVSSKPQVKKTPPVDAVKLKEKLDIEGGKKIRDIGLTVRIEINLPAVADQDTYDMIFKSIRENLIDVE